MTDPSLSTITKPPGDVPPSVLNPHLKDYKQEIDAQLEQDLAHLKTLKNAFVAIDYIMYTLFPDFLGQSEIGMTTLANHLKVLSQDSQMIAYIQSVFNGSASSSRAPGYEHASITEADVKKAINEAIALYDRSQGQAQNGAISKSTEAQLNQFVENLFKTGDSNGKVTWANPEDTLKSWHKLWDWYNNPGIGEWTNKWKDHGKLNSKTYHGTYEGIKNIEDQFDQMTTSLNGTSQIVQSNDKFETSQYNEEVGVLKQVFAAVAKEEKNAIDGSKQTS